MNPETSTPELNKALVAAQAEMPAVPFDSKNPFFSTRYASLGSVIATSRPILAKHGLAIEQKPYSKEGRIGVKTIMRHVSGECSESELDMPMAGEKGKSAIQEAGSVITYLRRYAWSAVCGLYADEDTDGNGNTPASTVKPPASPVKPVAAPLPPPPAKTQPVAPQAKRTPKEEKEHITLLEAWLGKCKSELLAKLEPVSGGAREYAIKSGMILPNELLSDATLGKLFPSVDWNLSRAQNAGNVKKDFDALTTAVQSFMDGDSLPDEGQIPGAEVQVFADLPPGLPLKETGAEVPRDEHLDPNSPDAPWRSFPMPWGKEAGTKLVDLDKKYLYGLWLNYTVQTEYNGRPKKPESIAKDQTFRVYLDQAGGHYEFAKKREVGT